MITNTSIDEHDTITITPESPTATMIFLHGVGNSAHGCVKWMEHLSKALPYIKFVLPTATKKPVTINNGDMIPSWYDIQTRDKTKDDNSNGIEDSKAIVQSLIDREVAAGIPYSRIVLGGFSQGGAMSLFSGFQMSVTLAGVLAISCYLPNTQTFAFTSAAKQIPLLMCHGDADSIVYYKYGKMSKERLVELGVSDVEFKTYEGLDHVITTEELDEIKQWIHRVLPPQPHPSRSAI